MGERHGYETGTEPFCKLKPNNSQETFIEGFRNGVLSHLAPSSQFQELFQAPFRDRPHRSEQDKGEMQSSKQSSPGFVLRHFFNLNQESLNKVFESARPEDFKGMRSGKPDSEEEKFYEAYR